MTTERYFVVPFRVTDEAVKLLAGFGQRVEDGLDVWDCWLEAGQRERMQQVFEDHEWMIEFLPYADPLYLPRYLSPEEALDLLSAYYGMSWCYELEARI